MIDLNKIHKGMDVLTSDGRRLGTVRELLGHVMFLDNAQAISGDKDTSIPLIWIIGVDDAVRLAKSWEQVQKEGRAGAENNL